MTTKFTAAVAIINIDAVAAWEALTMAQRGALRRCHTVVQLLLSGGQRLEVPLLRLRSDTHARTKDSLRRAGAIVSDELALTDIGALVRSTGMAWEASRARTSKARKGLR